uniref:Uncharacterized protein n=1 Tax=Panagrolaimus sp. JU765 TaxID=591449 RepID=A0AC34RIN0_9BILA
MNKLLLLFTVVAFIAAVPVLVEKKPEDPRMQLFNNYDAAQGDQPLIFLVPKRNAKETTDELAANQLEAIAEEINRSKGTFPYYQTRAIFPPPRVGKRQIYVARVG